MLHSGCSACCHLMRAQHSCPCLCITRVAGPATCRCCHFCHRCYCLCHCCCQVGLIRHSAWSQLGPLLQEASCPSLILQAAQQQQHPHHQQQQRPRDLWDHAVGAGQGGRGLRAAAAMAEGPQGGATPSIPYHQLCQQLGHLQMYSALVCALTADALTPLQKAHWIVASYPW
jgi:hypothetical protein